MNKVPFLQRKKLCAFLPAATSEGRKLCRDPSYLVLGCLLQLFVDFEGCPRIFRCRSASRGHCLGRCGALEYSWTALVHSVNSATSRRCLVMFLGQGTRNCVSGCHLRNDRRPLCQVCRGALINWFRRTKQFFRKSSPHRRIETGSCEELRRA